MTGCRSFRLTLAAARIAATVLGGLGVRHRGRAERDRCIHASRRERLVNARSRRPDNCPIRGSLSAVSRPRSGEQSERSLRHGRGLPHNAGPSDGKGVPHDPLPVALMRVASRIRFAPESGHRPRRLVLPMRRVLSLTPGLATAGRMFCRSCRSVEGVRPGTDIDTNNRGVSDPGGQGGVDPTRGQLGVAHAPFLPLLPLSGCLRRRRTPPNPGPLSAALYHAGPAVVGREAGHARGS